MTIDEAKAQAKALRTALLALGNAISHAQALELVARQHGAKDWNTLHARLALRNAPPELAPPELAPPETGPPELGPPEMGLGELGLGELGPPKLAPPKLAPPELGLGDRVRGRYLGQAFAGRVVGLSGPATHRQIEIRFDHPVDVVRFESFSNPRSQVRSVIDESGRSHRQTSDGLPQLIVAKEPG